MEYRYKPSNKVCSQEMIIELDGTTIKNVKILMSLRTSDRVTGVAISLKYGGFPRQCAHWLGMTFLFSHYQSY